MKKKGIRKIFSYIIIFLILATFLLTFSITGCGRRALLREKLKSRIESEQSESSSDQSSSKNEVTDNDKENMDSEDENNSEESAEQESTSDESAAEESVSGNDDENVEEVAEEEEAIEEQEPVSKIVGAVEAESGCTLGETVNNTTILFVGDSGSTNEESRIYISYDISELSGSVISEASITATAEFKTGNPFETYGPIIIKSINWGKNPVPFHGDTIDGVELANFTKKDFTIDNEILKEDLQKAVSNGSERYQITLYFEMNGTDGDNVDDHINYKLDKIVFDVTYIPPAGD
jgi:hypothetical protein